MNSRRFLLLGTVVLLAFCACKWDLWGIVTRPTVEDRVKEDLSGNLKAPSSHPFMPESYQFAVFGDPQVQSNYKTALGRFRQDIADKDVGFFCVLGDLTEDATPDEVDTIKVQLDRVDVPLHYYVTIGNHDLFQSDGWERFKQNYGPSCYSVVVGRTKLIFLDTADGTIGPTQFDWFEKELQDTSYIKLVLTHYPLFDGDRPMMYRLASDAERAKVQSLLERYGVYAWCAGHTHALRHTLVDGVHHFTCGGMAPQLDYGKPGYLLFTFAHDSLSWQFVELDWQ